MLLFAGKKTGPRAMALAQEEEKDRAEAIRIGAWADKHKIKVCNLMNNVGKNVMPTAWLERAGDIGCIHSFPTLQRSSRLYTMQTCLSSFFSSDNTLNSNHDFLIKSIIIYVLSFSGQAKLVSFISQLDAQNIAAKMTMRTVVTTHRLKQEL